MQRIRITGLGAGNTPRYQTTALETMHGDYLGTCSAITDGSGTVVWESTADAWGAHATATGTATDDRGVRGHRRLRAQGQRNAGRRHPGV